MLRKLFGYDFRAIGKNMWLFTIIVVVMSALGCGASAVLWEVEWRSSDLPDMARIALIMTLAMVIFVAFIAIVAYAVLSVIFIIRRYYTNLFTDEGYLTFTLPAKVSTIFNAKVLSGVVWTSIVGIIVLLCFVTLWVFTMTPTWELGGYTNIYGDMLVYMFPVEEVTTFDGVMFCIEYVLGAVAGVFYEVLLIYLCITLGSVIAKKGKLPLGLGLYFGANAISSTFISITSLLVSTLTGVIYEEMANDAFTDYMSVYAIEIHAQLLMALVVNAVVAVGAYLINRYLLKNKLNLP